ncbi:hypothetical protein BpHYR1_018080 [Brachionus plicatilis]|uniref:Uncharacterized protein n=1 Tax=Brachionus plicatilis TaxID=10195 RepID=A0A3M7R7B0_BRAPC|nr:hypothetical protein BpHYR1_018080 [Brachionus plicatilis]
MPQLNNDFKILKLLNFNMFLNLNRTGLMTARQKAIRLMRTQSRFLKILGGFVSTCADPNTIPSSLFANS